MLDESQRMAEIRRFAQPNPGNALRENAGWSEPGPDAAIVPRFVGRAAGDRPGSSATRHEPSSLDAPRGVACP